MSIYSKTMGKGHSLVMLHGWGFDSHSMQNLAQKLAQHYQVICIDLPGFGNSIEINAINLNHMTDLIAHLIPEQASITAWSLGGLVAMNLTRKIKLKNLSLIGSSPRFIAEKDWPGISNRQFIKFKNLVKANLEQAYKNFAYLQIKNLSEEKKHHKQLLQNFKAQNFSAQNLEILEHNDLRSIKIDCPLQIILGEHDQLLPRESLEKMKSLWPHAQTQLLKNQGHMPFLSDADTVAIHIHKFMSQHHVR